MSDRRAFLKTLAAAGAASLVPGGGVFGQERRVNRVNVPGGAIDVHHHFPAPGATPGARPWTPAELSMSFR